MTTNAKGKAITTGVKGKTKATGAKGKTKATGLKEFLSNLATDPRKLGEFLHDPEAAMSAANLSEADKIGLRSGVAGMVAARLAGTPLDQKGPVHDPQSAESAAVRGAVYAGVRGATAAAVRGVSTAIRGATAAAVRGVSTAIRGATAAAVRGVSAAIHDPTAAVLPPVGYGMTSEANKAGSLVVVGTGIGTVGHLTMEALAWMQRADEIIHLVADPVAEALIAGLKPGKEFTLQGFYGEGKPRAESYEEMIEFILSRVRAGVLVCGAFYGHPSVFAYPPHESIRRARAEDPLLDAPGYFSRRLPLCRPRGRSRGWRMSVIRGDGLPHQPAYHRPFQSAHPLAGRRAGRLDHRRSGYDLHLLPILLYKLLEHYPPTHEIVVYEAPLFPGCAPTITRIALAQLTSVPVSAGCTLYVPSARAANPDYRVLPYVPTN